jgi:LuxR family transcriptional regulator, quorum-sensing system regulator BjaR1
LARNSASVDIRRLTPREREIISWVALGKPDWQIGRILMISPKTVNYHVETAKRKLGATTRGQAVAIAAGLGLLDVQAVLPPSPPAAR